MPKNKLKPGFDPVWSSEFLDIRLKKMSKTAFIIRQMYRSYRNPENNTCNLSDLQIRNITGWHLRTIQKARQQLIRLGEIIPTGYHSFAVKAFHQYQESLAQSAKLPQNDFSIKGETSLAQKANDFSIKGETVSHKRRNFPVSTDTDTDKTDSNSASPVSKEETPSPETFLQPEGIKTLKMLYGNDQLKIKRHLERMGISEAEADLALGKEF